jgi:hypothetical protein
MSEVSRSLAKELLNGLELRSEGDRVSFVATALEAAARRGHRDGVASHHRALRALLADLFPEHHWHAEPDEQLVSKALDLMSELRGQLKGIETLDHWKTRAIAAESALLARADSATVDYWKERCDAEQARAEDAERRAKSAKDALDAMRDVLSAVASVRR